MLKNKFGMFKVLALALSVLMLVSLAACGNDGMDDAAIQDAINAAVQSQSAANAAEQEKIAASLKVEQEKAESERLAAEESLKAANAAASQAAKEAADKAAAAEKAAQEAKKEAESKAAEASKQAAEASKQAAEASKAASKAAAEASSLAQASKDALTATTTAAPIAGEDLTAIKAEFAALKHKYTNPMGLGQFYQDADYEYLVLLFEKAAVELQNAMTVAAAESIVETLKTEVAAVKNLKIAAEQFNALVADLGDIDTEVFTTAVDKKLEVEDSLVEIVLYFTDFFDTEEMDAHDIPSIYDEDYWGENWEWVDDFFGTNFSEGLEELNKANTKIKTLTSYIAQYLTEDMETLYNKYELDFDDEGADLNDKIGTESVSNIIARAYYEYLLISKVNGGDVAEADLEIEWDYLYDENGKVVKKDGVKVLDPDAPIAWFTVEEFVDIYVTPYLNSALEETKVEAIAKLYEVLTVGRGATEPALIYTGIVTPVGKADLMVSWKDAEDALEEIAEEFEAEIEDITFVGDYKGNVSLEDAQIDIWTKNIEAYIAAANTLIEGTKEFAAEVYAEKYADDLEALYEQYEDRDDESSKSALAQKIANLDAKKDAFEANLEAATGYTFEDFLNIELIKKYEASYDKNDADYDVLNYITADGVEMELIDYIIKVYTAALKAAVGTSVSTQEGALGDAAFLFIEDLIEFRDRLDPTSDDADLYNTTTRGTVIEYINGEDYKFNKYYTNTAKFEELVAVVDKAIADIEAVSVDSYTDKEIQIKTPDNTKFGDGNNKKALYWVNEEAKAWFYAEEKTFNWLMKDEISGGEGKVITKNNKVGDYITLNNTGIPVTYTRTAEEQAILAAQTLYANAFSDIYKALIALGETNYLSTYTAKINNSTEYKAIKTNVKGNAALLAEVEAYAKVYTDKLASIAGDKKYAFDKTKADTFVSAASTNDYIDKQDAGYAFVFTDATLTNAENFVLNGLTANLQSYVDKFDATFYTADKKESNVVLLYYYKQTAIEYITETIDGYKNTYTTITNNKDGVLTTESVQTAGSYYKYDLGATKASVNGKAFEAQLDALLESYVGKINAVTLNARTDVKNYFDVKIFAKPDDFAWTLTTAQNTVSAYVVDLLGEAEAGIYAANIADVYSDTTYDAYKTGDSRVLAAFRTYYLGDFTAYAPVKKAA